MENRFAKGQMVFEFMVALVLIIAVVFYVINTSNSVVLSVSSEAKKNNMESRAVLISNVLVYNPGVWSGSEPSQVGLAVEWPVLNSTKVSYLEQYCENNYADLLERLDTGKNKVRITIDDIDGNNIMVCGPEVPEGVLRSAVKRFALAEDGTVLSVNVWVW